MSSVEIETEVAGTPEQVWPAIATGPGISAWFVPAEVEERPGGAVVTHHGPEMTARGTVTVWEPPFRFAYDEPPDGSGAPAFSTEFIVEPNTPDTCLLRLTTTLSGGRD